MIFFTNRNFIFKIAGAALILIFCAGCDQTPESSLKLVSGFDETRHVGEAEQEFKASTLVKPYSTQVLLRRVRQLLNSSAG